MRKAIIILFVFVLVFCFVACDMSGGGSSNNNDSAPETLTIDLSDIRGSSKTITVGKNTLVSMENLKLEDGVFVDTSKRSRSYGSRDGESGSKNIFKTQGGGYMMVPDKNHHGEFHGSDLGIVSGAIELGFRVFNNIDDDLSITSEEYPIVKPSDLLEEFYYINFFDPKYKDLNTSRVVVVGPTMGGYCEFSIIQFGDYERIKEGILDFSAFPGFGLYLFRAVGGNDGDNAWGHHCYVLSPKKLNVTSNVSQTISNEVAVFDVDIDDGQYYKITVHYDSDADLRRLLGETNERYYNGETRDKIMIPVVDATSKTITYYLGAVDRPFLFTMDLSGADENAEFTFTCEASDQASFPGFVDLCAEISDGPYTITVPAGSVGNFLTVAIKITDTGYINTSRCNNTMEFKSYLLGKGSKGGWRVGNSEFNNTTENAYIIFDCRNKAANDELFSFSKDTIPLIECPHMIWDAGSERYICADGLCAETYKYDDMFNFQRTSFDAWYSATVGGHKVKVWRLMNAIVDDLMIGSSENAKGENKEFASLISHHDDHTQRVQVSVKEMKTDENKLVTEFTGDVILNVSSRELSGNYKDVVFTLAHSWNVSGDTATCDVCGETRNVTCVVVEGGTPITLNVSGLKKGDELTIKIPALQDELEVVNAPYGFPSLPYNAAVYLISPTSDSLVECTKSGASYNITVSY